MPNILHCFCFVFFCCCLSIDFEHYLAPAQVLALWKALPGVPNPEFTQLLSSTTAHVSPCAAQLLRVDVTYPYICLILLVF